jgi:hypothetical protein
MGYDRLIKNAGIYASEEVVFGQRATAVRAQRLCREPMPQIDFIGYIVTRAKRVFRALNHVSKESP